MTNTDRVFKEQLFSRVAELYPCHNLDIGKLDFDGMTKSYSNASNTLVTTLGVKEQREWAAYGCGFASFLDSWFYHENKEFEYQFEGMNGKAYRGVFVIFSLLEPMFAAGEGQKNWDESGNDTGYLPSLSMVDEYSSDSVRSLSQRICRTLRECGIPQASRRTLQEPIDSRIQLESNMANDKLTLFDAFYHWMD